MLFVIFSKPDSLRNMAWLTLIKAAKEREGAQDPYEAVQRYLPYNSDIRCAFAQFDSNEKNGPPAKRLKLE